MSPVQMPIVVDHRPGGPRRQACSPAGSPGAPSPRRSSAAPSCEARQIVETADEAKAATITQGGRARGQGVPAARQGRLREGDARQAPGVLGHREAPGPEGGEHRAQGQPDRAQGVRAEPARRPPLRAREVPRARRRRRSAASTDEAKHAPREERRDDRRAGAPPPPREPPGGGQVRVGAHDPQGRGGDAADLRQEGQGDHQHRDPALRERLRRRVHRLGGAAAERGDEGAHHRPRGAQHPHPRGARPAST